MKVSDLQPGIKRVNIVVKVVRKGNPRSVFVKSDNTSHQVVDLTVGDETGVITMSLWDNMINLIKERDIIQVSNGYVSEFGGKMQLNVGKFGQIERLDDVNIDVDLEDIKSSKSEEARFIKTIECLQKKAGINLVVKVAKRLEERTATTKHDKASHTIFRFLVGDESACINFVIWDQGDEIQEGDVLEIRGAYTRDFRDILELNISRNGSYQKSKLDILDVNLNQNLSQPE